MLVDLSLACLEVILNGVLGVFVWLEVGGVSPAPVLGLVCFNLIGIGEFISRSLSLLLPVGCMRVWVVVVVDSAVGAVVGDG